MAAATTQDDQGNVVQVGEEGGEGGEGGEYQDAKGRGPGDERGWGAPDPRKPRDLLMEEHVDTIPWIPYHLILWIF